MAKTSRTYPLDALQRLRGEIRSRHELALAAAVSRLGQAEQAAERARTRAEAGQAAVVAAAEALGRPGPRSGASLHVRERYHGRLRREARALEQAAGAAEAAAQAAGAALEAARAELAAAEAELKLVERDHEAWDEKRRKAAIRKAEEELEDLVAARHVRKL